MNTASLELCKELYELSGWDYESQYVHATDNYSEGRAKHLLTRNMLGDNPFDSNLKYKFVAPAYDLGYLLRKLPQKVNKYPFRLVKALDGSYWAACYDNDNVYEADTPEDAACKLLVELIKQGIITP